MKNIDLTKIPTKKLVKRYIRDAAIQKLTDGMLLDFGLIYPNIISQKDKVSFGTSLALKIKY
jgi:hypothetical protein